jgi:DNA-binding XRE family transcriptional regulator
MKGGNIMDNNIYRVIIEKEMTQADLARMVGVKREYVNRIINRKVTPTVPLGMRIANALEVSMEDLFIIEN